MNLKFKLLLFFIITVFITSFSFARTTVRYIDALKVIYTGNGGLIAGPSDAGDFTYKISITGLSLTTNIKEKVKDTLVIKPTSQSANSIFIDEIVADGSLNSIKVTFPPGKNNMASCVRNINVKGYVNKITIINGDLGAPDGHDGQVNVVGPIKQILVKGKKHKIKNTDATEWWGGNIWADINIENGVSKIIAKGGNIYYYPGATDNGMISINGDVKLIASDGVAVKTNETDKAMFGGAIKADIFNTGNEIKQIRVKGGRITDSGIYCRQIKKVSVKGQKAADPRPLFSVFEQGISKTYIQTTAPNYNYKDCSLKNVNVKNGSVFNSLFSVKGDINSIVASLETPSLSSSITNSVFRAGTDEDLSQNESPTISPTLFYTGVVTEAKVIIPFTFDSIDSGETLAVRIHNRGPALDAVISNYYGQSFGYGEAWKVSDYPESGMFVWITQSYQEDVYSNIIVRVSDNGIPNKFDDLSIIASVTSSNLAPILTISPDDNPRIVNLTQEANATWTADVFDMNLYDIITFSIANNSPGLLVSNLTTRSFYIYSTNLIEGVYSNITFTATDNKGLSDSKIITLYVTSNSAPVITTTLTGNKITTGVSNSFSFYVTAISGKTNTLTFPVPSKLPSGAVYTQAVYNSVLTASNKFSWTPAETQTGTYNLTFIAYDSDIKSLTGEVAVVITVTNGITNLLLPLYNNSSFTDRSEDSSSQEPSFSSAASYPGKIGRINANSSVYYSQFIAGVKDEITEDWQNASYLGRMQSLKIEGGAYSNIFISLKKISIWQGDTFDFSGNAVWIDGTRAIDNSQK
ncbi:MAG: hypothetical protein DRI44_05865 [Chlamydiae bacterium]|nr:MAG: hypothetical protein DRI44_05865 [Chlamydiota bacterium]